MISLGVGVNKFENQFSLFFPHLITFENNLFNIYWSSHSELDIEGVKYLYLSSQFNHIHQKPQQNNSLLKAFFLKW